MTQPAWQHLAWIVAIVLVATAVGFLSGHAALFAAIALAVLLLLNTRNLLRFEHWLRHRKSEPPPDMNGLWGEVTAITSRLYRRKVFHKQRVLLLLREFRRMTSAMPDGAVLLGPNREILWFNRAAGQWLDLRRKADYGIRIDNLVRNPEFVGYLDRGGNALPPRIQLPDRPDQWFMIHLVTANATGQQLLIVRDVTAEARLDSMRKDFVANAAHELRSPLTVITGYLDSLAEDPGLDEVWREPVREMRRQSERMRGIVQDLLELSKLEAQGGEAEASPVDVGGMLALIRKDVTSRPEPAAPVNLAIESDAQLLGSESELHSAFANLVSNAVKYTPADGRVDIRWWVDGDGGHVSVRDTGIGIPAEHLPRLTERFYRVDAGRSRRQGGSGLGLAIVKHALQRHDARLEIRSQEGKGSTFTCHFPRSRVLPRASTAA
ncbi:MAG: phosphate regulon sensor histidine kinase PhoR [Gammaproteobacteria bacterium]|nr:phosphate regulon sensor histidine kinase PhoR [Gammaproteobacteria bacterium]